MGTNFYHEKPFKSKIHIGKSSCGWTFLFHGTSTIRSASHWREITKGGKITDEYGTVWSYEDFWAKVEGLKSQQNNSVKKTLSDARTCGNCNHDHFHENRVTICNATCKKCGFRRPHDGYCRSPLDNDLDVWLDEEGNSFANYSFQ